MPFSVSLLFLAKRASFITPEEVSASRQCSRGRDLSFAGNYRSFGPKKPTTARIISPAADFKLARSGCNWVEHDYIQRLVGNWR